MTGTALRRTRQERGHGASQPSPVNLSCLSPHSLTCFPRRYSLRRSHFLYSFPLLLQSQSGAEQRLATDFPTCVSICESTVENLSLGYSYAAEVMEMSLLSVRMTRMLSGSTTVSFLDRLD
jgi:hypothetical protein